MIRVWVARDTNTLDPVYAARDATSQALAGLRLLAHDAGMVYDLREDEGYAAASFTGDFGAAQQLLLDLAANAIEVFLIEVTTEEEHEKLFPIDRVFPGIRMGAIGGAPSRYGRDCPVELVQKLSS